MYNSVIEHAKLRAKSKLPQEAKDENRLEFGDDFSSFPVEHLKLLAAHGDKYRLGFREVISIGLSKLPTDVATDVTERMRDEFIYPGSTPKDLGGAFYTATKGNFKSDPFMHRIASEARSPPCWVVSGPEEVFNEAVLNQGDAPHYRQKADVVTLVKANAVGGITTGLAQSTSSSSL